MITVYTPGSSGNVSPVATIAGSETGLSFPNAIALDSSRNIYVGNIANDGVTVYPAGSNGNVIPAASIMGPDTGLASPFGIALGASGNIYVANYSGSSNGSNGFGTVTVCPAGDVAPSATIGGRPGTNSEILQPLALAIGPITP